MISCKNGLFRLAGASFLYAFYVNEHGLLEHLHWGAKAHATDDLLHCMFNTRRHKPKGAPVVMPGAPARNGDAQRDVMLLEWAEASRGDFKRPSYEPVFEASGSRVGDLRFQRFEVVAGKPAHRCPHLPGLRPEAPAETLKVTLGDEAEGLSVTLFYTVFAEYDVLVRWAEFTNSCSEGRILLQSAMSVTCDFEAPAPGAAWHATTLPGAYLRERAVHTHAVGPGVLSVGSRRGLSSHQHNPFLLLTPGPPAEDHGEAFAFNFVYSGNFLLEVEQVETGRLRCSGGIHPDSFSWALSPGETFETPEMVLGWSGEGVGGVSRSLHRAYRDLLFPPRLPPRPWGARHPVLCNTWEACYFNVTAEEVLRIGRAAAALGVEVLLLDDGWFGQRDNDTTSLGDWHIVNANKFPEGLRPVAEALQGMGLAFGLWVEPECVSEESDLYRQHPDWCLRTPHRQSTVSRSQLVLDYTRSEVREYMVRTLTALLEGGYIAYVKWDFNRSLSEVGSAAWPKDRQGEVAHRYMLGVYEVMAAVTDRFPAITFESCSSGGGRTDPGLFYFMPQAWSSDNTDFLDRLRIQHGSSLAYPPRSTTAHVSAVPNHQTGRASPFHARAVLAMLGGMGFELDLSKMSEEEKAQAARFIQLYKRLGPHLDRGALYRLWDPFHTEGRACAWLVVDDTVAVLFAFIGSGWPLFRFPPLLRLPGLRAAAEYSLVVHVGAEAIVDTYDSKSFHGSTLMNVGLPIFFDAEKEALLVELRELSNDA
eukprot:EG_transcript_3201